MVENKNNRGSDSEPPTVSIIVPAFNSEVTIGRCLRALHNQTYPQDRYEIIVVDDASTDKTAEIASKAGVLVVAEGKLGKSGVRNLGAQRATGEIILFTDSDCEPIPNWIELMVAPFIEVDVAGVKGAYWSQQTDLVARFTQIEVEERYRRMAQQESINFIDTYAAGYRREIFLANNGFDETLPEDEDQDLSFRLARQGYKMVFVPQARVFHQHTTSVGHYVRRKYSIGTWKPLLINRYPERFISDSRTPQSLKIQMGLVLLMIGLVVPALFSRHARRWLIYTILSFLVACLPFLRQTIQYDREIGLIAVPMLWLRAAALALGYLNGLIRFRTRKDA
jgi:cellulose synthase/poly-beta-1,6-N-acetylglucosamine synthase-like glycosyltransferase